MQRTSACAGIALLLHVCAKKKARFAPPPAISLPRLWWAAKIKVVAQKVKELERNTGRSHKIAIVLVYTGHYWTQPHRDG